MTSSNLVLGVENFSPLGHGGRWRKRKREGPLGPGTLLVHSDFSLELRAADDSHFLCVLWPLAIACHQEFRSLGLCALASGSVEVRSDILGFIPPQETQVAFPRKLVGSFLFFYGQSSFLSNLVLLISSNLVP